MYPVTRRSLLIGAGGAAVSELMARPMGPTSKEKIAVVGAGVFGAWTAHHLLQQGHDATLIDAWGPARSLWPGRDLHANGGGLPSTMESPERDRRSADPGSVRHPVLLPDRGSVRP